VSEPVIEIRGLRKEYRSLRGPRRVAVDGLDLDVPAGCVFGFLGPNGSGKTTTIRCLLGLVRPTAGSLRLLGAEVPGRLPEVVGRVGSIVETPQLFPTMSGRRNLMLLARLHGIGRNRVDAVLERTGLSERGDDLVRRYSLGMKQRLGVAAALLKDPALLVLDEPANGLDPGGIREIRLLLRELAREGRTVFISSHLLGEVAQTCDAVAILRRGRCVASGPVDAVLADRPTALVVRVADLDAGAEILRSEGLATERLDGHLRVAAAVADGARVSQVLGEAGHWVSELRAEDVSLEDLFLELTQEVPT
jgi:ABC-type multidrug transport system ATPase subunit